jgi:transposase
MTEKGSAPEHPPAARKEDRPIVLSPADRKRLEDILSRPAIPGCKVIKKLADSASVLPALQVRAKVLLMLEEGTYRYEQSKKRDSIIRKSRIPEIAQACGCSKVTVNTILRTFTKGSAASNGSAGSGVEAVLGLYQDKLLTPALEQHILALSRTPPPKGCHRWTAKLLGAEAMKQGIVERISLQTVLRILWADDVRHGEPLNRCRKRDTYIQKVTPAVEQRILALSRQAPPEGYLRWTGKLLVKAAVEQGMIQYLSTVTVGMILHKAAGPGWITPPTRRPPHYPVVLTPPEKERLEALLLESPPKVQIRASVLLLLTQYVPGTKPAICVYTYAEVARRCNCTQLSVINISRRFCEGGLDAALNGSQRRVRS